VTRYLGVLAIFLAAASLAPAQTPPASPLRVLSPTGSRPLATVMVDDVEMVALEDLAVVFPMTVKEDAATRAITIGWEGQTIVLTPDQSLASAGTRLISLPAPPRRIGGRWYVPVEFLARALAVTGGQRIELRKPSRLVIVGAIAVPRVVVRHEMPGPQARLTFDISPPTPHTVVQEADRLVVQFQAAALDATLPSFTPRGFVRTVRVGETGAQLIVELGERFGSFRASDAPGTGSVMRLVIDIFPALETAPPPPGTTTETPPAETPPLTPTPAAGIRTVVIDPGHGGDEHGARGAKGTLEKDVTLAVARRLKAAIEARLGTRVLLTRDDDRTVPLDERAALANNNKADLFISLHANASPAASASGAEVFYLSLERQGEEARRLAEAERVSMPVFGGGTRDIDVMLWQMAQARYIEQSAAVAALVEEELRRAIPMGPSAIQQGPFRVLVGANMPAVLVELGYLSNTAQEQQLRSSEFPGRAAQALLAAVVRYDASVRTAADSPAVRAATQP
jgi:N-acetylmuramoyl-L-alanine amidase